MATKAKSGKQGASIAPPAEETLVPADGRNSEEIVAAAKTPSVSRRRRPPQVKEQTALDTVVTVDERLKKLSRLPSLQKPVPEPERLLRADPTEKASRPPDPTPPFVEPEPSKDVDHGSTIPENYGLDRLAVLPRDPHWLFVYWELHGGALERLRFQHSAEVIDNARWVLRVRPANDSGFSLVDIDLRAGQWYLNVASDAKLLVDMGFVDQMGQFVEVVKGCTVTTPRERISSNCDERWMILRDELEKLLHATGAEVLSVASSERPPMARSEQPRALGIFQAIFYSRGQGRGVRGQIPENPRLEKIEKLFPTGSSMCATGGLPTSATSELACHFRKFYCAGKRKFPIRNRRIDFTITLPTHWWTSHQWHTPLTPGF